ncbi:MAG: hypothetical protein ABIP94_04125 [Planctomycetota bacterium]
MSPDRNGAHMSGESQPDAEPDFLDDDFILEDIAAKNEGLDQLFEMPDIAKAKPAASSEPDSDDMLFTDHSQGVVPTEKFEGGRAFSETERSGWTGDGLDLEAVGVPTEEPDFGAADAEILAGAEASFTEELDSLLQSGDDFALDSDKELEVVDSGDGISEFEQSGPFVIDDGEGAWQEAAPAAAAAELGVPLEPELSAEVDGEAEPGWEPLAPTTVDELSEVDEVARSGDDLVVATADADDADAEDGYREQESTAQGARMRRPALVGVGAAEQEGHDIYPADEGAGVIGARGHHGRVGRARRVGRMLIALAASLMIVSAGAVVVLRPEWVGLQRTPERMQQAQIARPVVAVSVATPSLPKGPSSVPAPTQPEPVPTVVKQPAPTQPEPVPTVVEQPAPTQPEPVPTVVEQPAPTQPEPVPTVVEQPVPTPTDPALLVVVSAPAPDSMGEQWPVPVASGATGSATAAAPDSPARLLRLSEELLMGEREEVPRRGKAADGVMPGSRAFAQLHNGNYFIGSVKSVDAERLTLRVETGEVTLAVAGIARLTELGSADYAELQKVTSGFVRLTNNNRLVGGILSHIADDHVVLEFRSNRVMLPRSAIGQVVQGEDDASVRLDTTLEEDNWLRRLIERQLGSGTGVAPPAKAAPAPTGGARTPR